MIDQRFCTQLGTAKQHNYIAMLASCKGYSAIRYAAADALGLSVSKLSKCVVTVPEASKIIEFLKSK